MNRQLFTRVWTLLLFAILAVPLSAQQITVQVDNVGGLWDALEAQGVSDFTAIKNLKVTGAMGESDFLLIKNQMSNLEVLDISGTNVTEVPNKTFYQKEKLKTVRLPEEITYIRSEAFYYCQNLESVTFGNQAVVEGKIVFPASLKYVDGSAFYGCQSLTKLDFSSCTTLEGLGGNAFQNLYNLQEVLFPSQGNLRIEWYCFGLDSQFWDEATQQYFYKGLKTLTLTKAVTYLSGYALPRTLNTLYVESTNPPECDENAFSHFFESESLSIKIFVPKGSKRNYAIANGWGRLYQYMQEMGLQLAVSGYGSVQQGNRTYTDGDVVFVNADGATTLKAVPEVGCELISVKLNGNAVSVAADGTFTVPAGTTVGTLELAFTSVPMVVNNPNGGELKDNIAALSSNPRAIRALKVVGKLTTKDWTYINSALTALEDLDISETDVKVIPEYAFQENQIIKTIKLPSTVVTIDRYAFQNCQKLTTVDGCENVETLRERAFQYCSKLTNFPFGDKLQSIESAVFENCSSLPESLVMPASVTSLGWDYMFYGSSVKKFDLSQCEIRCDFGYNAFGKCTSLLLPEKGDYRLCYQALKDAELTELRLPAALSSVYGEDVFPTMLKHLYVSRTTPIDVSSNTFNNIDFDNCTLYVPSGSSEDYEAAAYWSNFYDVKELGFKIIITGFGSLKLGNITFSNGDVYMPMQGSAATLKAVPDQECQLLSVTINGNAVSVAADGSFTIPEGTNTGTINVVFSISQTVVDNPNGGELKDMIAAMGITPSKVRALKVVGKMNTKDWNYVKSNMPQLEEFDISETDAKLVPENIFQDRQYLTTVHLPSTVVTIDRWAFQYCYQLTTVDGCENVKEIHERAFSQCNKLANFPFGEKLQSIESGVFENCSSLPKSLVMPASVTSLGWDNMFNGSSVKKFDLSQCEIRSEFGYNAFGNCTSLLLPEKGDYRLCYQALKDAELTELRLPAALTYMYGEDVLPTMLERLFVSRTEPIGIEGNRVFRNLDFDNCTLYVPQGSKEAYSNANYWSDFANIKEFGMLVTVGEQGKVRAGTQTMMGTTAFFPTTSSVTFEIIPNAGWHADAVTVNGTNVPFADNQFTLSGDQLSGKLAVSFAINQFALQLQLTGDGQVKLGSLVYTSNQVINVDSLSTLNFTLVPAEGLVVSAIAFNGQESVVQNGGTTYVTPAITANSTLAITFAAAGAEGEVATYNVTTGEGGSVEYKNTTLLPETTIQVKKGEKAVFTIKPEDYYIIEKVLFNGTSVIDKVAADGKLTIENVDTDATLEVAFRVNAEIAVNLDEGIRLTNLLNEKQKQLVTKLTITGRIQESDFFTMRDEMPMLSVIDMWQAETDYIPYQAFCTSGEWWSSSVGKKTLTSVRLPQGTYRIGGFAFAGCTNLKEVNFTELTQLQWLEGRTFAQTGLNVIDLSKTQLTDLGGEFYQVKNLENIKLPKTLTNLNDAFYQSSLTEIDLSECTNLKSLSSTFNECKNLVKVTLPEGLTSITSSAFGNCEKLTTINFPISLVTISGSAFYHTNLQKVDLSGLTNLQSIGDCSFQSCQELAEVLFPSSLVQLGNSSFNNCYKLTSIDLSKTKLQNIPEYAFSSCEALESVKLPKTIETIDRYAFAWDNKLGGVLELGAGFTSIGECAFEGTQISVIRTEATTPPAISSNSMPDAWVAAFVPEGYADVYKSTPIWEDRVILDKEVHADVTVSFEGNLANDIVEQAHIAPATVTHLKVHGPIGPKDFAIMRSNMTLLYDLDLEDAECNIIPENAFLDKKVLMNVKLPRELLVIQENAFRGCSSLKGTLTLPAGVTTIGWGAFQGCTSLEKVELSEALEVIRGYAFEGCSSLQQELTFPQNFTSLGVYAFANCRSLYGTLKFNSEFYMFMGNEGYWSSEGRTFENCSNIEVVDMSECEYLYQLPQGVFSRCTSLHTVMLPPYLERIEYYGFEENTSLRTIAFPSSLMYIDDGAFQNCSSLKSINLSDCQDFGTLGGWAFANNASLESVNLPASLNWIGSYAFSGCRKLGEINVEALEPADLGDYVFQRVHTERCVLSIPTGTYSDYLSAPQWGEFVSMRKAIDVSLDEGASLTYSSGDGAVAGARGMNRAPSADGQQGNVNVKDGSSLYVAENDNVTFYINPEENVSIKQVLFNGEDVTAQMQGNAFVTPGLTDNSSFMVMLNVDGPITVKELRMLEKTVNICVAESHKLVATVYPTNATNKKVLWSSGNEQVARVDEDGTVTGVAAGRTIITAKTEDGGFEQQCELVVMSKDYYITLADQMNTFVDYTVEIPLMLHNADMAQGIQFDVYLPDGLGMDYDWSSDFGIHLTGRSQGHTVTASRRSDGSVRVIVYSLDGNAFSGNDGELLTLPITTREKVGDFYVEVKNIHISGPNSFNFTASDYRTKLHVADYPLGDSNGNGEVTISDATNIVESILERWTERFIKKASDVNGDGVITVSDVTGTIDIILERPLTAHARGANMTTTESGDDKIFINDFSLANGQQQTIDLQLTNTGHYIAFQCDIILPEGLTVAMNDQQQPMVSISSANAQSHVVQASIVSSGALRLLVMSMSNSPFAAANEVATLTIEANASDLGQKVIEIQNVRLVNVDDRTESLAPDTQAIVDIVNEVTNAKGIALGKNMKVSIEGHDLVIVADADAILTLVAVDGTQRVLKVKAGTNRFFVRQSGMYILQGRKIMIK